MVARNKEIRFTSSNRKIDENLKMIAALILFSFALLDRISVTRLNAQSIGFHPNLFLGFNPYLSPVFGYGLGIPYGAHGGSAKLPFLSSSLVAPSTEPGLGGSLLGKVHAKTFLKKFSYPFSLYPHVATIKNKLQLLKHPEYSFTPYGVDYGYGKHYGSALVPNNPYKSAYGDYYNQASITDKSQPLSHPSLGSSIHEQIPAGLPSIHKADLFKSYSFLKPLIKAGALITTAALLGKKTIENPSVVSKLNPAGMIINDRRE